ncbi:MAG TPA: NusG domain II-containing protein [Defluviitoga sp.]|nr:NusG domain II-containing protein [Defluviitoga sp.]HOP25041.1 NusG domain II-containing protein [Defluviitoga sp.]HPZ29193.1 NusG domain II-containing protein [Defluviitoga sp.]HQD63100.1 NusG domain II-containing protein [Defluviitoga sp.]
MKFAKKSDFFILIIIFGIIILFMSITSLRSDGVVDGAQVFLKGEKILEINKEGTYSIYNEDGEFLMNVEYYNDAVRVTEASCPDKVCQNTGWVSTPNQPIVCIPNKVVVKPTGKQNKAGVDLYTW